MALPILAGAGLGILLRSLARPALKQFAKRGVGKIAKSGWVQGNWGPNAKNSKLQSLFQIISAAGLGTAIPGLDNLSQPQHDSNIRNIPMSQQKNFRSMGEQESQQQNEQMQMLMQLLQAQIQGGQ